MASKKPNPDAPPKGRAVTHDEADDAVAAFERPLPSIPLGGRLRDVYVAPDPAPEDPRPAPSPNTFDETAGGAVVPYVPLPDPVTAFQFLDRGWRPMLGVIAGVGFFYSFVAAPVTDRKEVDEAKLWVLCTLALGLAGSKTVERIGPGMMGRPQGLFTGPPLVTR